MGKYILYHGDCMDGSLSAFLLIQGLEEMCLFAKGAWPVFYDKPLPPELLSKLDNGDEIYILDFSLTEKQYIELDNNGVRTKTFEHHSTKFEKLGILSSSLKNAEFLLNGTKAGCEIVADIFSSDYSGRQSISLIGRRDRGDLWKAETPETDKIRMRELNASLSFNEAISKTLKSRKSGAENIILLNDGWIEFFSRAVSIWIEEGALISKVFQRQIEHLSQNAFFLGEYVCCYNNIKTLNSDLGNLLAEKYPARTALVLSPFSKGINVSARTTENSTGKTAFEVAEKFGGGGHKHASGFTIKTMEDLK